MGPTGVVSSKRGLWFTAALLSAMGAGAAAVIAGCASGGPSSVNSLGGSNLATTTVRLSDPATCQAPSGPFSHVYVTITDVKASTNSAAGDNDTFVDLTPGLASAPKQIDLLGQADNQCFLASLGSTTQLQPGSYQQIRMMLADNSATVAGNHCGGSANCVVLNDGTVKPLQLSSESKTGIKIPSGQIANGGFTVAAGQTKDLDVDFNTCISIVQEGNGQYRLKPVLHAGEVSTTSTSINGVVVDSATGKAIGGQVLVALEQRDSTGVDRVFMNTLTDASGGFTFCPLPAGTYDVVVVGVSTGGTAYAPSVITGVSTGSALGTIQLHPQTVAVTGTTLKGAISSATTTGTGTVIDAQVSALETVSGGLVVTVPLLPTSAQPSAALAVETASGSTCTPGTDCASYSMLLPASGAYAGTFAASGTTLTQGSATASYVVDAIAYVPSAGGALDCSNSELKSSAVTAVPAAPVVVGTLSFTGCQ